MDITTEKAPIIDINEKRIANHLSSIDSQLAPYTSRLAKSPFKDLSTPEAFVRKRETLEPKDLVAVHLTDNFPDEGIIHPTAFYHPETLRFTVHTTINSLAPRINTYGWNWEQRKYGILIPLDKVKDRILAFNPADTFFLEDLELPEGTVILKDKNNQAGIKSAGKAQIIEVDYSQSGDKLNGFHLALYKQMIEMGYFPQDVNEYGDWYSWGSYGLPDGTMFYGSDVWEEFCKRSNLEFARGNPHAGHWTGILENFAYYMGYWQKEKDQPRVQNTIEGAQEFLATTDIPEKYKKALENLINQYRLSERK